MTTPEEKEMLAKLPYSVERPATSEDVTKEVSNLALTVAGVVAAAFAGGGRMTSPKTVLDLVKDHSSEPGRSVLIAEVRLSLALETWQAAEDLDLLKEVTEMFQAGLKEVVGGLEQSGHLHLHRHEEGT